MLVQARALSRLVPQQAWLHCRECKLAQRDFQQLGAVVRLIDYWTGAALAQQQLVAAQQLLASLLPPTDAARMATVRSCSMSQLASGCLACGRCQWWCCSQNPHAVAAAFLLHMHPSSGRRMSRAAHCKQLRSQDMLSLHCAAGHVRDQRQLCARDAAVHA